MMYVVEITKDNAAEIAEALLAAKGQVLIAYDSMDDAVKVKIDWGIWSPPIGRGIK